MADKNRNRQDQYRSSQYESKEDRGRQQRNFDEYPNYSNSENRGYREGGRYSGMQSEDGGWESRNERQLNHDEDSGSGYTSGRYGNQSNSGYGNSKGGYRNLYDRDYEGINRSNYENKSNRLGAANYGTYGDRGRYDEGQQYGGQGNFQSGGNYYGSDYNDRNSGRGHNEERSWWNRTSDEVSSWFGDEDAERRRERDRNQSGRYRGKGPRNYNRSDDRIKEDVNDRLSDDPFVDASEIEVTVSSGEVTLTGTVDHRSSKRRAEDLAESVSGVKNVENRLRVGQRSANQNSGNSSSGNPSGSITSENSYGGPEKIRSKENSYANSK